MQNSAAPPMLEVTGLRVVYGHAAAVHGASLRVGQGSVVTVIGSNGAGKTSTLAALMGVLPASGVVLFEGVSIAGLDVASRVARRMVLVPEKRELFEDMTVQKNLMLGAYQRYRSGERDFRAEYDQVYKLFPRLSERRRQIAGTLSGGERQMVAIGVGLMGAPKLLMLDEPTLGLSPRLRGELAVAIEAIRSLGVPLVLVDQDIAFLEGLIDTLYLFDHGRISRRIAKADMPTHEEIMKLMFGEDHH